MTPAANRKPGLDPLKPKDAVGGPQEQSREIDGRCRGRQCFKDGMRCRKNFNWKRATSLRESLRAPQGRCGVLNVCKGNCLKPSKGDENGPSGCTTSTRERRGKEILLHVTSKRKGYLARGFKTKRKRHGQEKARKSASKNYLNARWKNGIGPNRPKRATYKEETT